MTDPHDALDTLLTESNSDDQGQDLRPAEYADDALALRFTQRHADDLRYVSAWNSWLRWDGTRWRVDKTLEAFDLARRIARQASGELVGYDKTDKLATAVGSAKTVAAIERLARADRFHASDTDIWDQDPWLLNTPGGTVNLRSGGLRSHHRDDAITKVTAVTPEGDCPQWCAFLDTVFRGDRELIAFVRRMLGYSLTGSIRDHALFFLHGTGGNGKGVLLNTWHRIMGEYSCIAGMETFVATKGERHPTDLAMLRGARVVIAQETEDGQRWAESRIKALTGGDPISARLMRQDFFTFEPVFKLMIAGNHRPSLRNVDEAVRRRFHLVPFEVTIPREQRDPNLPEKLRAEWPGILAWAIEGCVEWQRIGLAPPAAVLLATESYLAEEDAIGRFLDDRCDLDETGEVEEVQELFASWRDWCTTVGEYPGSTRQFSQKLEARGLERVRHPVNRRKSFRGIRLTVRAAGGDHVV